MTDFINDAIFEEVSNNALPRIACALFALTNIRSLVPR